MSDPPQNVVQVLLRHPINLHTPPGTFIARLEPMPPPAGYLDRNHDALKKFVTFYGGWASRVASKTHVPRPSPGIHAGVGRNSAVSTHKSAPAFPKAAFGIVRDSHGRNARSQRAKSEFKKQPPCLSTGRSSGACPGCVIEPVKPLKRAGVDKPGNMRWQAKKAAEQKDKIELGSEARKTRTIGR